MSWSATFANPGRVSACDPRISSVTMYSSASPRRSRGWRLEQRTGGGEPTRAVGARTRAEGCRRAPVPMLRREPRTALPPARVLPSPRSGLCRSVLGLCGEGVFYSVFLLTASRARGSGRRFGTGGGGIAALCGTRAPPCRYRSAGLGVPVLRLVSTRPAAMRVPFCRVAGFISPPCWRRRGASAIV